MRDLTSPENFEALVREHQGMVFRTLTRMTGGGAHVEDLAQEAFLRLYRALPDFRGDSSVATYLYRIVVNLAQTNGSAAAKTANTCSTRRKAQTTKPMRGWRICLETSLASTGEHPSNTSTTQS